MLRLHAFSPATRTGLGMVALLGVLALAAPWLPLSDPVQPAAPSFGEPWPPHWRYPCGTDELGRDVCSRLLYGARLSLFIAACATVASLVTGTLVGLAAGYWGNLVDRVSMRVADVVLSFPVLLLAMGLAALFEPNVWVLLLVIAAVGWTGVARTIRAEVLSLAQRDFVLAARALGSGSTRILIRHILPSLVPILLALSAVTASQALLIDAGLSFIGLGVPPPAPSWGRMLSESQAYYRVAPWLMIFPGFALGYTITALQLVAWGLSSRGHLVDTR